MVALWILSGCASVPKANIGEPTYALEADERRMMKRADELCEILDASGHIDPSPELEEYLNRVAHRLLPEGMSDQLVHVRVLNDPSLNAFALPNGRIYVHTGILAAMENEAQLAALLAHEMTHILHRHALKQFRSVINKSAFLSSMLTPIAAAGGNLGAILTELAVVSSIYGYSQQMEYEADENGFSLMAQAGYDVKEAGKLFEHIDRFIEDEEIKQPFFFSTHPQVRARIKNFQQLAEEKKPTAKGSDRGETAFVQMTKSLLLDNFNLCMQAGMFKTAQRTIMQYQKLHGEDAVGFFYLGELFRERQDHTKKEKKRDKTADYENALHAYERAIELDSHFAGAYKGKAMVLQKQGNADAAKVFYQQYLTLAPQAVDRRYIEQYMGTP